MLSVKKKYGPKSEENPEVLIYVDASIQDDPEISRKNGVIKQKFENYERRQVQLHPRVNLLISRSRFDSVSNKVYTDLPYTGLSCIGPGSVQSLHNINIWTSSLLTICQKERTVTQW